MSLIAVVLLLVLAVLLRLWQTSVIKRCNLQELNLPMMPIIGHIWAGIRGVEAATESIMKGLKICNKQGGVVGVWALHYLMIVITDPADAEFILKNHLSKGGAYQVAKIFLGNGSLIASVRRWRPRRKICAPLFTPKNLSLFVEIFSRQSETMTKLLRSSVGKGPVELWPYVMKYSFDAVCNSALGINIDAQNNPDHPFTKAFANMMELLANRIISSPLFYFDAIYKLTPTYQIMSENAEICYDFVGKIVREARENYKAVPDEMKGIIPNLTEMLAQNEEAGLSEREQCEEVLVFVMAGLDTSAVGISFTLHMLARHPDIQDKVYRELMEVFNDDHQLVTEADLLKLVYLECVIKETLRLYPPGTAIGRTVKTDERLPSGVKIPKGTFVAIGIYGIHRNEKYWGPDVEEFRPERFLEPLKHPKQFIPFSDGPRNCIGYKYAIMSMKTALATLLRQYRVLLPTCSPESGVNGELTGKATSDPYPISIRFDIIVKDKDNVRLCLESRHNKI